MRAAHGAAVPFALRDRKKPRVEVKPGPPWLRAELPVPVGRAGILRERVGTGTVTRRRCTLVRSYGLNGRSLPSGAAQRQPHACQEPGKPPKGAAVR
jgi:hypothetical protein